MRFIPVRELRGRPKEVWRRLASEGEVVITSHGKPVAVLLHADEENLEEQLAVLRRARATAAVDSLQRRAVETGRDRLTQTEIEEEIRAVRGRRRR